MNIMQLNKHTLFSATSRSVNNFMIIGELAFKLMS